MNKIEEILQKYTGCEGTCECSCGLIEAMRDFGKICFEAALLDEEVGDNYWFGLPKHSNYEDFLKSIEYETGN